MAVIYETDSRTDSRCTYRINLNKDKKKKEKNMQQNKKIWTTAKLYK